VVGSSRLDSTIAIYCVGLQPPHQEFAGLVSAAANEDAAAANWSSLSSRGKTDEIGADVHACVRLHVPQRERALEHIDAIALGSIRLGPRVGSDDVEAGHIDMASAHLVAR